MQCSLIKLRSYSKNNLTKYVINCLSNVQVILTVLISIHQYILLTILMVFIYEFQQRVSPSIETESPMKVKKIC